MTIDPALAREPEVTATLIRLADSLVEDFDLGEVKTSAFRKSLTTIGVTSKTALLVDSAKANKNLVLSSRNLAGIELLSGNQVHPYHLLRYEAAVFSRPALERLQDTLKASAPRRKAEVA